MQAIRLSLAVCAALLLVGGVSGVRAELRVAADFPGVTAAAGGQAAGELVARYRQDMAKEAPTAKPAPVKDHARP